MSVVSLDEWVPTISARIRRKGWRYGHLTCRRDEEGKRRLEILLLNLTTSTSEVISAAIPSGQADIPSITPTVPAAHWAERAVGDLWGIRADGHPAFSSVILNEAWPTDVIPFHRAADGIPAIRNTHLLSAHGSGIHEIPVGPVHAGIIEPGHFRFTCIGEVILNLEIRHGFQHRGIENRLATTPWRLGRFLAESASSDETVANGLAHAVALERLSETRVPDRANSIRTISLEIERIANHIGDLGGLSADVGFAIGAATFARLRGVALGLGQTLAGSRFQRGLICPGGLAWDIEDTRLTDLGRSLAELTHRIHEACELFFTNPGINERYQGIGILPLASVEELGIVGPSARCAGSHYDARRHFDHALYPGFVTNIQPQTTGDCYARAIIRRDEIMDSLDILSEVLKNVPKTSVLAEMPDDLAPNGIGIGIVESWRGELIHWITTGPTGTISRYVIRDPSFQNWIGISLAGRNNLIADFPLINKSFSLSYAGSDL